MKLKNKIALVTGASSGIGAAIAIRFAAEGADIVVNYNSNSDGAEKTAEKVRQYGRKALVIQADVGQDEAVSKMFSTIKDELGKIDILINNAGVTLKKLFMETAEEEWDRVMNSNLKSVFLCSKAGAAAMREGGVILNISSIHSTITTYGFSVYGASKGGMESLTRSMAIEFGARNIRVNALRLGWIQVERDNVDTSTTEYKSICERFPIGHPGEVSDVASSAIHLCTDESQFITGQVISLDGGNGIILNTAFPMGCNLEQNIENKKNIQKEQ